MPMQGVSFPESRLLPESTAYVQRNLIFWMFTSFRVSSPLAASSPLIWIGNQGFIGEAWKACTAKAGNGHRGGRSRWLVRYASGREEVERETKRVRHQSQDWRLRQGNRCNRWTRSGQDGHIFSIALHRWQRATTRAWCDLVPLSPTIIQARQRLGCNAQPPWWPWWSWSRSAGRKQGTNGAAPVGEHHWGSNWTSNNQ